ncbi:hypothetical protein [Acidobacterium sp. S8]|uniref:hypothetical protein n=1 Tax=Acidobacterium sp. S8 TaxID=1641854 RepID=UPI00131AC7EF|nr:hypothetical protein [Acidobacterium sp. S8]
MSSSERTYSLLKDCALPDPLHSGNEYKLCPSGFALNHRHSEAQTIEVSTNYGLTKASDEASRTEWFEALKAVISLRQTAMTAQFDHVKDCFICSVAFGLTPDVSTPLAQRLAKLARLGFMSQ